MENRIMALSESTIKSLYNLEENRIQEIGNYIYIPSGKLEPSMKSESKTSLNDLEVKKATIIYHSGEKLQEYIQW